jgi:superfamily II DNA or RNA helicase
LVTIKVYDPLNLKIDTDDADYVDLMKQEFTRRVPGFQFTPAYKSGHWSGSVCMIDRWKNTFPYGLLLDYIRAHKKSFPRMPITVDQEVKDIFKGPPVNIKYDLNLKPRPYQKDCIEACLNHCRGIIRSATASGKSLVIAYIIRNLLQNGIIQKSIIVVPSTGLITQFFQDLVDYGFKSKTLGTAFARRKQWDKQTVISTWQTLAKNHDKLNNFDNIICDETHGAKAYELKKILENATNAQYRLGFTGTLHASSLDNWNTKAYLGPVIREYPSGLLAEQGWISKATIHMLNIEYNQSTWEGEYHDIRDAIFQNDYRLKLIKKLTNHLDHNVLLLVDKVEKEGELLQDYLKGINKEIVFLSGRDNVEVREMWRKACMKRNDVALIATYGIFQMGINIPNLKYIIMASPFKAKIRVLQSIGRALRLYANKEKEGAQIYDIHDHTKFFEKYGDIRLRYYDQEKFTIKEIVFHEGDSLNF